MKTKTKEAKKSDADEGFEPARQKFARLCIYFEKPPSSVVRTTAKRWTHPLVSTWIEDSVVDDTRPRAPEREAGESNLTGPDTGQ